MARKAKRLAAKWGGQCIVFIDEIDAVGHAPLVARRRRRCRPRPADRYDDHCFYGPYGSQSSVRRPDPRDPRLARADVRAAPARRGRRYPGLVHQARRDRQPGRLPGDVRRRGPAGAQPAARDDGRHRQPAVLASLLDEPDQQPPRRVLRRPAPDPEHAAPLPGRRGRQATRSTSSGRRTCRSRRSTRRSSVRAAWAATSGSGRRRSTTARTSSSSTSARSRTTPSSTPPGHATSSPGSRTGTRRRWSSRSARWR